MVVVVDGKWRHVHDLLFNVYLFGGLISGWWLSLQGDLQRVV